MDDLVNKTSELASLVSSLQQQGDDNSDLRGIIAQLEAAVAKRAAPAAITASEAQPVQVDATLEWIEPIIHVEIGSDDSITFSGSLDNVCMLSQQRSRRECS